MTSVVTVTLNPTIDVFGEAEAVRPTHKVRLGGTTYEPGGGGINVARMIATMGGQVSALALSGGEMGAFLGRLLTAEGIAFEPVAIHGQTRVALMVRERTTGLEYRFLPEGPTVTPDDIARCVDRVAARRDGLVVASGSLLLGAPADSFVHLARAAARNGLPFVLDTSGEALRAALEHGGLFLVKPSRSELEAYSGGPLDETGLAREAQKLVEAGKSRFVALTLGADGALLASPEGVLRLPAIPVPVRSAVGAGDSFLGAMVWALTENWSPADAFRLGLAAGSAAAGNIGATLCTREDVFTLYQRVHAC
jgi:6-phosphofructokinase 2